MNSAVYTRRFGGRVAKPPKPLRISVPDVAMEEEEDTWTAHYPYAPPPTPTSIPRRETPLDEQRFDPLKTVLAATSPSRYAFSGPDIEMSDAERADSLASRFPTAGDAYDELLAYHMGNKEAGEGYEGFCSGSGASTPTDETGSSRNESAYHLAGAGGDGVYGVNRAILRAARSQRHLKLSKSLGNLAGRSTATLRRMPSFTNSSGASTLSPSDEESDCYDHTRVVAPPTSRATSRRPSLAVTPFPLAEVTESLRRLAVRLVPGHGHGIGDHFEESVGHYEEMWARETRGEPLVEVLVTRTQEMHIDSLDSWDGARRYRGLGSAEIGIYASKHAAQR
ncbi:hypothetical protein BN946_scf184985.g20 [Trametes cinnabarina]|uniref:Uncharacterized protein n=1 Tax=Pycnoporus cinnabarinus TaxID=5643 RepID=A0A060SEE8_PYCCI|nr:hypothetical protein BN946_scf184985.g20 [Trametes cinnabarina]